jgi:hypothetical protein
MTLPAWYHFGERAQFRNFTQAALKRHSTLKDAAWLSGMQDKLL